MLSPPRDDESTPARPPIDLEAFFGIAGNMLCVADREGTFLRVSRAFTTVLGWSADELCSCSYLSFVHPDDLASTLAEMASLSAGAMTLAFENRYACKDGTWKFLRWNSAPDDASGLIYASAQDVTDRHVAHEALDVSKRRIEQILSMAGEGIVEVDATGVLTYANPAVGRMLGARVEDIIGRLASDIAWPVDEDGARIGAENSPLGRVLSEGRTVVESSVMMQLREGGHVPLDVTVSPVPPSEGTAGGAVAVLRDATERLSNEIRLAQQAEALERSNVELQQFAYVASHDLQEPLRKIASYVQILESDYADQLDAEGRECIQFAVDGAHRMRQLIEDLLTVARVRVDNMCLSECDTSVIMADVVDDLAVAIGEMGAVVEVSGLPTVSGDAGQLRHVFQNLLANAVKYRGSERPRIRVSAESTSDGWLFTVADNGAGFKQEYADKVFVMFQRLVSRRVASGTGMGLAIVRKAVENHGGRVWAESEPGVGSTFRFTLPAPAASAVGMPARSVA